MLPYLRVVCIFLVFLPILLAKNYFKLEQIRYLSKHVGENVFAFIKLMKIIKPVSQNQTETKLNCKKTKVKLRKIKAALTLTSVEYK